MKKFIQAFQFGLELLDKSTHGDINFKYPIKEEKDPYVLAQKKQQSDKSRGHLKVIK